MIFTCDNGPFLSYGSHAGSAGKLRCGKLTVFEGGVRVPCIMRWPQHIPAGRVCEELITTMDLVPTLCRVAGGRLPTLPIDGKDVWPVLSGAENAKSPHEKFLYYAGNELHAIRSGEWKLHFPHPYLEVAGEPGTDGKPSNFASLKPDSLTKSGLEGIASRHGYRVEHIDLSLYNLREDVGETRNVIDKYPDVVKRLQSLADEARADLGDSLTGRKGSGLRSSGRL